MKRTGKRVSLLLTFAIVLSSIPTAALAVDLSTGVSNAQDLVQYVNPLIGSDNYNIEGTNKSKFAGLAPFVMAPFAMTNFTPQTQENKIGQISYEYWNRGNNSPDANNKEGKEDTKISGFFASHQPAIWMGDYGYMNVMPQVGAEIKPDYQSRRLAYSHGDETSTPYYYSVKMDTAGNPITGEMTATERCAMYRFTFEKPSANNNILIEASRNNAAHGYVKIDVENQIVYAWNDNNQSGQDQKLNNKPPENLKGYYAITFDRPFTVDNVGTYMDYAPTKGSLTTSDAQSATKGSGAYLTFATTQANEPVEMTIGTSFISFDQAKQNVKSEIGDKSFAEVKEALRQVWNEKLNIIQIEGADNDELHIFYTAMFHAMMYPRKFYEADSNGVNHYYSPYDDQVHEGISYTDFSLWDTFRCQNSFLTLVEPENVDAMVTSLLQNYQEGGYMPKWPNPNYTNIMIGTHADSVVAEAIQKGLLEESKWPLAYEAIYKDAMVPQTGEQEHMWSDREKDVPYEARGGLGAYKALGYVPNRWAAEDVSRTMEFAYDDWCAAQVAKAVGKDKEYKYFLDRSLNYKNGIDPVSGYAMGRSVNGDFNIDGRFTEGSSQKYTWLALHDPQGLADLMTEYKGADFYNNALETAWAEKAPGDDEGKLGGWIDQQNEPCHHYAYMFDFSGRPDLTQKYARKTMLDSYKNETFGMIGNDDCGQMSAWYVFSAMGFYPVNPASGEYMIGSPLFDKVTIHNPGTKRDFVITAANAGEENCYIQSATLNGQPLNVPMVTYEQITAGGTMGFAMGNAASDWAKDYKKDAITFDGTVTLKDMEPEFVAPYMIDGQARFFLDNLMKKEGTTVGVTGFSIPQYEVPTNIFDPATGVLTDGDYNTGFRSDALTGNNALNKRDFYITVTWTTPQTVDTAYLVSSQALRDNRYINQVDVEVSVDGTTFTPAAKGLAVTYPKSGPSAKQTISDVAKVSFPVQTDIKALRLKVTGAKLQSNCFDLTELELYNESSITNDQDLKIEIRYNANKLTGVTVGDVPLTSEQYTLTQDDTSCYQSKHNEADKKNILTIKAEVFENISTGQVPITLTFNHGKAVTLSGPGNHYRSDLETAIAVAQSKDMMAYTVASGLLLQDAVTAGQAVIDNDAATDGDFETAYTKLAAAIDGLVPGRWGYKINYTDTGATGTLDKVNYVNGASGCSWGDYPGYKWSQPAKANANDVTKTSYSITFNGTKAVIYSAKVKSMGVGGFTVDNGEEIQADFYGNDNTNALVPIYEVYSTPELSNGEHTLTVRRLDVVTSAEGNTANGRTVIGFSHAIIYNLGTDLEAAQIALLNLVNEAADVDRSLYTAESLATMDGVLTTANAQLRDSLTEEAPLKTSAAELRTAIDGLEKMPGHVIAVATADNGTVIASAARAEAGEEITLTVTPAKGYELDTLTVTKTDDNAETVTVTDNKFTMPDYDVTVTATFKKLMNARERADAWVNIAPRVSEITAAGPGQTGKDMADDPRAMIDNDHLFGFTTVKNPVMPYDYTLTWDEPQSFDKVKIFTNNGMKNGPTNITFYTSASGDEEDWQIAAENMELVWLIDNAKDEPEGVLIQLPEELKDVTHLKMQVNAYNNNNSQLSIREIEIYNKEGAVVPFAKDSYTGDSAKPLDIMLVMSFAHFTKINDGTRDLVLNTDFELSEERRKQLPTPADEWNQTLTLTPSYLETLTDGIKTFTVTFTGEDDRVFTANVKIDWAEVPPVPTKHTVTVIGGVITGGTETSGAYEEGENVSVTANAPEAGYQFKNWTVTGLTGGDRTENPLEFSMPAENVTLTANYEKTADQVAVEAAKAIVEGGTYTVAQAVANTEADVKRWLTEAINALSGMGTTGVTVNTSDIDITAFTAAVEAGENADGSNGRFTFTATLTKGGSTVETASMDGGIIKKAYTPEGKTVAPVFVHNAMAFADADAASVTFALVGTAVEAYAVYATAAGGDALSDPAWSVEENVLTLTFTEKPENATIYYISATEGDKDESDRTAVTVKPYDMPPEVDASSIDEAIAGANEAKTGISINENPESSVSQGVRYVTQAEMDALTDAIATAEAAKETVGSTAEAEAVAAELNTATETFKAAIKTGTYVPPYTPPSGGSNTTTETEKNPDGSTTKTVTDKKTGNVTETTTYPDGTKIVATTPKDGNTSIAVTVPKDKEKTTVTIPTAEQPKPGEVAVIIHEDGTKEVVKTSVSTKDGLRVTLTGNAKLEIVDNSKSFTDVPADHWGTDAIAFVTSRELFNGGDGGFQPTENMSRAMLFTVLARLDGQDLTGGATWYENAMLWAKESGVSDGANPEQSITRESLAVMLYRYAGSPKVDGMTPGEFTDAESVSDWASDAMLWCVDSGILTGSGGKLNPADTASRAEVAMMLQRFISL